MMPAEAVEEIAWKPATQLASDVRAGVLSPVEVAEAMAARIEAHNPKINAYVTFDRERLFADAARLAREVVSGQPLGPLHGVPFAVKELTSMKGLSQTSGLLPLRGLVGEQDAALVRRLREAGGLFLGQTNTPEVGYYGGTDGHLWGPTHNPWRHGYTAGGSSGGSAAAVAAGLGQIAEGSDGAGSVRIPSALCGVFGFKPSLGRIPTPGFSTNVFHGPITRTVADAALMLRVMVGPDPEDPLSLPFDGTDYVEVLSRSVAGWRVAWSPDLGLGYVDPEVARICAAAASAFVELGATVVEITPDWGHPEEAMWNGLWVPGYARMHDRLDWDKLHGQVDDNLIELIGEAESLTAVDVGRANAFRTAMWETYASFMSSYDILLSPTLATAAFPLDRFAPEWLDGQPLFRRLLGWLLTYPFNMLPVPAATVPAGFTADGRPVGLQIAGRQLADAAVLTAAAEFERARPWSAATPPLATQIAAT